VAANLYNPSTAADTPFLRLNKQERISVNHRRLATLVTVVSLIYLLLPQNVFAEDLAKSQTHTPQPTQTEVSNHVEQPVKQTAFQVSTDKNMEKKRGSLAIGLGVKRKGILFLPVLHMKAQQPSLKEKLSSEPEAKYEEAVSETSPVK
jgi:hypothetical protein